MGLNVKYIARTIFYGIFSYSSTRSAKINSLTVAFIFRIVQILILGYIIGWELVYKKGYQSLDPVSSTVTTKVKGIGYNNDTNATTKVFDVADFIIPPNEYNSIFVMSSFIETDQSHGICEEDYTKPGAVCKTDADCQNVVFSLWNGIPTGKCINASKNSTLNVCEVSAWCPVEDDVSGLNNINLHNVLNFTIFIKNDVEFKTFHKKERNILTNITNQYLASCSYEPSRDPYCPVFLVGDILKYAEKDSVERDKMLRKGGVVQIVITWNCNYDYYSSQCLPKYTFERFDLPFKQSQTASGFNFRFADKYKENNIEMRKLVKAYGLRFIIIVEGKAGRFNVIPLLLTIGAGLGLLSLSTIVADVYMLTIHKHRKFYKKITFLDADMNDEESINDNVKIWYNSQLSITPSTYLRSLNDSS